MTRRRPAVGRLVVALAASTALVACGGAADDETRGAAGVARPAAALVPPGQEPRVPATPAPDVGSRREPRTSFLSVPRLGIREVPVVRYRGRPDDGPGTRIQDRGRTASPRGPWGGVGPGEVGNFIVTGHRTSHGAPFADLPSLRRGDLVRVRSSRVVHLYRVTATRSTSFRSEASRRRQEAAVPGRPGVRPTRAMLTLSTCATPEDHARGNYWADRLGNPEHRIDKLAVLVRTRRPG